jgi:hypothetical protein
MEIAHCYDGGSKILYIETKSDWQEAVLKAIEHSQFHMVHRANSIIQHKLEPHSA